MKQKDSSLSKKFITAIGVIYSLLIIFFAVSFNIIINNNTGLLRDTLVNNNSDIMLEKTRLAVDMARHQKNSGIKEILASLALNCAMENGYYQALVFSKTSDDNYFKIDGSLEINKGIGMEFRIGGVISEEKEINYLRKGLFKETAEPKIYSRNNFYWQNIYQPFNSKNKHYVIQFMMSASKTNSVITGYYSSMNRLRWISSIVCLVLIISVATLTLIFIQNYSILIKNLSRYMEKAAKGDLSINIKATDDRELNELAQSFNSLIEELKDKSSQEPVGKIFKLGVEKLKENSIDDSIILFKSLTLLKPDSFGSYFNLGVAFAKKKNFQFSLKMFNKSMEINPDNEMAVKYMEKVKRLMNAGEDSTAVAKMPGE